VVRELWIVREMRYESTRNGYDIVRPTGSAQGAVQQELNRLWRAGLLSRTAIGRQVHFQANRDAAIFPELHALLLKRAGLVDVLREALAPLGEQIRDHLPALRVGGATRP
jgi:hypothetical protein